MNKELNKRKAECYDDLRDQIDSLRAQVNDLQGQLAVIEYNEIEGENVGLSECVRQLQEQNDALRAKLDEAKEALDKVNDWARAYPLDIFPEPDWHKAKELLGSNLLSCVSASNMRHVINGVKNIVEGALQKLKEDL